MEKIRGSKDLVTKFDSWSGVKDLNFIIPRNFSNLSSKTGGRSNLGMVLTQNITNEDYDGTSDNTRKEVSFIGLKSPDHLKKVSNMFRNNEFKTQPKKYMTTLKQNINYDNPEIFRGPIKTDILNMNHGNGILQMKVFKILNPKRKDGSAEDSDSEEDN